MMKDVWKHIVGPEIADTTNKVLSLGTNAPLNFTVYFAYVDDEQECLVL